MLRRSSYGRGDACFGPSSGNEKRIILSTNDDGSMGRRVNKNILQEEEVPVLQRQRCPVSGPGRVRPSFLLSTANNQPKRSGAEQNEANSVGRKVTRRRALVLARSHLNRRWTIAGGLPPPSRRRRQQRRWRLSSQAEQDAADDS
jgi:hypothetical protein